MPDENKQLTQEVIHEALTKLLIANPKQDDKIIEWIEVKCLHLRRKIKLIKWKQLDVITLGKSQSDNIN
jgi:hypothetical protein